MDEFEGSFVPVSDALPGPPMQAEPVASTALLPAITPAERKRSRAALRSPYLTPFIPSDRRSSPVAGQFLCVPRSLPEFSFSLSPSTHSTPLILPQTVSSSVLLHSLADPSAAQHLFRLLQEDVTPQISLEVIYRPLPAAFLNSSLYADSYGSRARVQFLRDGVRSWMSFVSPRATSVSRPCGLPSDLSLPPPLAPRSSGGSRGTALVLIGAVLCMTNMAGDAHCFHISLPCPLPLPRFSLATSTTPNSHSGNICLCYHTYRYVD